MLDISLTKVLFDIVKKSISVINCESKEKKINTHFSHELIIQICLNKWSYLLEETSALTVHKQIQCQLYWKFENRHFNTSWSSPSNNIVFAVVEVIVRSPGLNWSLSEVRALEQQSRDRQILTALPSTNIPAKLYRTLLIPFRTLNLPAKLYRTLLIPFRTLNPPAKLYCTLLTPFRTLNLPAKLYRTLLIPFRTLNLPAKLYRTLLIPFRTLNLPAKLYRTLLIPFRTLNLPAKLTVPFYTPLIPFLLLIYQPN